MQTKELSGTARSTYEERLRAFRQRRDDVRREAAGTVRGRLAIFLLAIVLFLIAERVGDPWSLWSAAAGVGAVGAFFVLVARHRRQKKAERRLEVLTELNSEALSRLGRKWQELPPTAATPDLGAHPNAEDLDVVGPDSLERLLTTVSTGPGARRLREWLLSPAAPEERLARQEAVEELSNAVEFRQELAARARLSGLGRDDPTEGFLRWAGEDPWLDGREALVWTARAVPVAGAALLALQLGGAVAAPWWLLGPLAGVVFVAVWSEPIGQVMDRMSAGRRFLGSYGACLEHLEEAEVDAPYLTERIETLGGEDVGDGEGRSTGIRASVALRRLERWISTSDVRANHLIHVPLQILFFWDVHVLTGLERWKSAHGSRVGSWLDALAEVEALAALAALRFDHPEWCFPVPTDGDRIEGRAVGHPLIPPDRCVANDVDIGPAGTFLLVTGSNMSGKSTLLRSIGLNCVLGSAGGPVCAESFRLPALRVATSMRTEDSLSRGISTFMAELERVAFVVDAARSDGAPVLYLMDEPLQGTNEAERRTAVRTVLHQLLETRAIGAISTHDLRLHETDCLREAARPVHFTSRVESREGEMSLTFDHRLRPGPATSTNALDLLRLVGLAPDHP